MSTKTGSRSPNRGTRGSLALGLGGALVLVGGGFLGTYAFKTRSATSADSAPAVQKSDVDPATFESIRKAAQGTLGRSISLELGDRRVEKTLGELGLAVDEAAVAKLARSQKGPVPAGFFDDPGKNLIPLAINGEAARPTLVALKQTLDTAPVDARLDLENRKIHPEQPGYGVDVYAGAAAIELAARAGQKRVALPAVELPPERTRKDLGIDDISTVLSTFTTRFAVAEKTRNANLKLAASRIHGHIINPGETFSFNKVVGARSEKEGYKIAHVITAGEMVDGLAGGACQISTTLHGAAFFSGLDIVDSTPHSRPSTYVHMGLDATVVWPHTDLKVRNPFDFPVIVSFTVARGKSTVEILGKEKPYDKVAFEREVRKEIPFDTITREDGELPVGSMVVEQDGFPGYQLQRYRKFYKDGQVVKTDSWKLRYRPVTEYARLGINPDPNLPPPRQKKGHGPRPPKSRHFRMVQ